MRRMYDSIDASKVPTDGAVYLGYDDGNWPDANELAQRFPGKLVLRATVFEADNEGDVGDCEKGNMDIPGLVRWVVKRRAQGHPNPIGYFSLAIWPDVRGQFLLANVPPPPYIIADYDHDPTIPPSWLALGAVGKQWESTDDYDISTLVNYIQGYDMTIAPDDAADWVRAVIIDYWGREPTVAEQTFTEQYLATNGKDLTRAAIFDHTNRAACYAKRGW